MRAGPDFHPRRLQDYNFYLAVMPGFEMKILKGEKDVSREREKRGIVICKPCASFPRPNCHVIVIVKLESDNLRDDKDVWPNSSWRKKGPTVNLPTTAPPPLPLILVQSKFQAEIRHRNGEDENSARLEFRRKRISFAKSAGGSAPVPCIKSASYGFIINAKWLGNLFRVIIEIYCTVMPIPLLLEYSWPFCIAVRLITISSFSNVHK